MDWGQTDGWVVRYWDAEGGMEQTARFPDSHYTDVPVSGLRAAPAYAQAPSLAGKQLLRLEVQRYKAG